MLKRIFVLIAFSALVAGTALAHDNRDKNEDMAPAAARQEESQDRRIPEQVSLSHWTCKQIAELGQKYAVAKRLPDAVLTEGKSCPKRELAPCLLAILDKVLEKSDKEGSDAVSREDLDRVAALHEALKEDLAQYESYRSRREAIERMLAKPELPSFVYRAGVAGFLRGEGTGNFRLADFSYTPGQGEGRFLYRVKPYVYWHPTEFLDIHLEGQGYGFSGGSQEYHKYSFYQGFIEGKLPGSELVALKVGRQEFSYGSAFILGPDSFYDGLAFDAARLRINPADRLSVEFLSGAYATPFSGGVKGNLTGAYASYQFSEGNAVEAYGFRDSGSANRHSGEYLATWGGRYTGKAGPVTVELEPAYESGRAFNAMRNANDRIDAFGGHVDLAATSALGGYDNKILASYAYGAGNRKAADGVSSAGEFKTPNNDNSLLGDMSVVGDMSGVTVNGHHASGLQIYTLGWGVDVTKEVNFSATGRYFLANSVEQGLSRRLGLETDFTLTYNVAEGLSFIAGYDRFFTGGFFRDASGSGKDIDYGYLMMQFDLSKSKPRPKPVKG